MAPPAHAQRLEALWYLRGEESIQTFIAHADQITIVAPQVFQMDSTGVIRGRIDPRVIETARTKGVKLHPLVMNPGFDQPTIHRVLNQSGCRAQALRSLAALCRDNNSTASSSTLRTSTCARRLHGLHSRGRRFGAPRRLPALGCGRATLQ
jgi:hypothetical protein